MANDITITRKSSFSELLSALLWLILVIIQKTDKKAVQTIKKAFSWLNSIHDYSNEEGDIRLTGWQFLGFGLLAFTVVVVLSIRF